MRPNIRYSELILSKRREAERLAGVCPHQSRADLLAVTMLFVFLVGIAVGLWLC